MSYLSLNGKCMCGAPYVARVKKPTRFDFTSTKVTCENCYSRFLIQCLRETNSKGRHFKSHIDMLHLSKKAEQIVKEKLLEKSA